MHRIPDSPETQKLSESKRAQLLEAIDFIRSVLLPMEKDIRNLYEHVGWVKSEVKEVLTATSPEHRLEEIGDVIMILFRLSCFKHPDASSEEIVGIYENHPSFLKYMDELGDADLEAMKEKFSGRYSFLSDPETQTLLAEKWGSQWLWRKKMMENLFYCGKSKEPGKSPESAEFFSQPAIGPNDEEIQILRELWLEVSPISHKYGLWLHTHLSENMSTEEVKNLFQWIEQIHLQDERFIRMVFLDHAITGDMVWALGRILMLLGTTSEIRTFLSSVMRIQDEVFLTGFLALNDDRTAMMHFREYYAMYRLFMEQGFGPESFENTETLLMIWMTFAMSGGQYDIIACIEELRSDSELMNTTELSKKFLMIHIYIHQHMKKAGTYKVVYENVKHQMEMIQPHLPK